MSVTTASPGTFSHIGYVLRGNPVTLLSFVMFAILIIAAVLGPLLVPYDPLASEAANALQPPSWEHWFGTDNLGRDVFSRVVIATRLDLMISISAVTLSLMAGSILGAAAGYCDRIMVMRDGEVVERGTPLSLFTTPDHPYTRRLIDATPRLGAQIRELLPVEARTPLPERRVEDEPLLEVRNLVKTFPSRSGPVHAVRDVSFTINKGQTLGLVGESGCGKSTTSSMVVRLLDPTSGQIIFRGEDLAATPASRFARDPRRARIQMVFQDATNSLNPRHTSRQSIAEPLRRLGDGASDERIAELADLVGLPLPLLDRFPHQLSGGQKARVGIARAIALDPDLLILDEPTAALDVSIQAVVLNLLIDLQARLGISYLFVSHDLNVVRLLCDQVIVMQGGSIVEQGPAEQVMRNPATDYTRTLVAAAPQPPALQQEEQGL
jgi:peptide/nickel transport system ATP-binding protein